MKADQKRIEGEIKALDRQIIAGIEDHDQVVANLHRALGHTSNIAAAYQEAKDDVRRK